MALSDVVVCLAPLTPTTHRMIGARELDLLRPGSVFVNVSRGAIVDTDALIARSSAAISSPRSTSSTPSRSRPTAPISDLPNVFLSPHIASRTEGHETFLKLMVDELERFFGGHETLHDLTPRTSANRTGQAPPSRT